ncbi:MAG TPA: hypothetical protein VHL79_23990 [Ramlibacter sp.]|jgi:hypothetical protein|nr:hypothetical protein [Ramlibacter sp.]
MQRRSLMPLLAFALAAVAGTALALGTSAGFNVQVNLNVLKGGRCVSTTSSGITQAHVQVVCNTGEFVGIEANPGKPLFGTHGSASRFYMPLNRLPTGALIANGDPHLGAGTITALRIYNVRGEDGPVEMLVSF